MSSQYFIRGEGLANNERLFTLDNNKKVTINNNTQKDYIVMFW